MSAPTPLDPRDELAIERANVELEALDAAGRVRWALAHLPGEHVLSSSFGAQAAVLLHLVTRQRPDIPVVLVDTGYLFPDTYRFVDDLTMRLGLNLKVYLPQVSPAWIEARRAGDPRGHARGCHRQALHG